MGKIEIKKTTSVDLFPGSSKKAKFLAGKKFIIGDPHIAYQLYEGSDSIVKDDIFECCLSDPQLPTKASNGSYIFLHISALQK